MLRKLLIPAVAAALLGVTAPAHATTGQSDLARLKRATAPFRHVAVAEAAGYARFVDVNGVACIDMPGMGAMGIHYVNGALVGDPRIDALHPEAMVYEPRRNGHLRLAAVEYVVIKADWDARHHSPPKLFGHRFNVTASPNRYGLPTFYSLHVWVWKPNPAGTFEMWNPRVHCPG
jgi:hypothetical protein